MNLDSRYTIQQGVKYRQEDFGGVIYRRADDSLHFLNSQLVINLLALAETGTVREIAAKISPASFRGQDIKKHILKMLCHLEELNLIHELEH
ncbi:MAG: mycofactocin biosynthesis chaperone MftB [Eubacteriales bacterium]